MIKKNLNNMKFIFFINFIFCIIEFIGGIYTNSSSILSDAIHDLSDSISIGFSILLQKLSLRKPNNEYTYGYARYSIIGALVNLLILSIGSTLIIINIIPKIFNPEVVNYEGMFILAILGILVNINIHHSTIEIEVNNLNNESYIEDLNHFKI